MMTAQYGEQHSQSTRLLPAFRHLPTSCKFDGDNRSCQCDGSQLIYEGEEEDTISVLATPSASRSSSFSSTSSSFSTMDLHYLYDQDQYPSPHVFESIVQDYLQNLSCKKRDKALVDQQRYSLILQVLKDPRNTAISTAQFRFWVKKMFQLLANEGDWVVCHDDKPVAMQEQIYPILVRAHRDAHHGGRDKTSALVRKQYSWIPKELIARFVRKCPFCISRRNSHPNRQPASRTPRKKSNHKPTSHPYLYEGLSWEEQPDPPLTTSNMAASIATSAAATAVSTQWIETGTPFYYSPHQGFFNSAQLSFSDYLGQKPTQVSPSPSISSSDTSTNSTAHLPYNYDYYYHSQDKPLAQPVTHDLKPDMPSYVGPIELMSL